MSEKKSPIMEGQFTEFAKRMERVATSSKVYGSASYYRRSANRYADYTVEDIKEILRVGSPSELAQVSLHFYRSNGIYTHMINYLSNLLLFDTIIIPKRKLVNRVSKNMMKKKFELATEFVDELDVAVTFRRITKLMLIHGVYYGLVRDFGGNTILIQDLEAEFCRSRFKSPIGIDLLEFDLAYFDAIYEEDLRLETIDSFPPEFKKAYLRYEKDRTKRWFEVPEHLGVVFYDIDMVPYLIASLPACLMYDEAQEDERKRDRQELEKLLIIQMPIANNGEPVFDLDETVSIHQGVANMLSNADYINVLTTFGDTKFEDAQDATQASRDKLKQYKRATYDAIGSSATLFNAEGNVSLEYSVNRDTSVMLQFADKYANWLSYQLNRRYGTAHLVFDVEILPTTIYNQEKMAGLYLRGAQYGYSKMYAGAALGIKQSNLVGLVEFENDVLDLPEQLVPLQSSHTQSLKKDGEKSVEETDAGDKTSEEGGRPVLPSNEQDDKTIANKNAG